MGVPPVKNGPHPFLFFDDRPKAVLYSGAQTKGTVLLVCGCAPSEKWTTPISFF